MGLVTSTSRCATHVLHSGGKQQTQEGVKKRQSLRDMIAVCLFYYVTPGNSSPLCLDDSGTQTSEC
ncbi:hypothetical protein E2C01_087005 [Portunus trituberculatus]|uniref:Uncharacterized protein n=1 Tax=Portunus trituberculatus TaxID=210409 RepID=A0A5B7JAU6_PORTR|nr:hypothetical protein [Portunus trituberculatus]